jgi:putative copper resistance protein D
VTLFAIVAAAVVYLRWYLRLRARGDHWPVSRVVWFMTGLALAAWVTQGAPAVYGLVTFSGHMVEHMLLVMAVPLPLTFAAPVTLALRALPVRHDGSRGSREWLRIIIDSRIMRFFAHPVVAAANFAMSMLVFYYSPIFEFALGNHAAHLWMIFHFVLVGYFFFNALVGTDPGPTRPSYPMRIVLLFATMAFHAFFGVALTSSQALLAPRWYGLMGRPWGPDALTDQQYGGSLAWGLGEIPVVLLAIVVLVQWSRDDARESKRKDRQADRDDDAELRRYNAMLGKFSAGDEGSAPQSTVSSSVNTPSRDTPTSEPQR